MKKLLILSLACVFLFACENAEKTTVAETTASETVAETVLQTDGLNLDGIGSVPYPRDDFEPVVVHGVFPSAMNNYMVFGIVEDEPKELFAYYINCIDKEFVPISCQIPEEYEYDRLIPVYAGHGGGSGEVQFAVMLEKGDEKTYIAFNNFTYTDNSNYLTFIFVYVLNSLEENKNK